MRVICDDCVCLNVNGTVRSCNNGYDVRMSKLKRSGGVYRKTGETIRIFKYSLYSDSCRLIKIITKDGEILPEEVQRDVA